MDTQLKRGMLDVCVLAAIKDEDSYGYQIIFLLLYLLSYAYSPFSVSASMESSVSPSATQATTGMPV